MAIREAPRHITWSFMICLLIKKLISDGVSTRAITSNGNVIMLIPTNTTDSIQTTNSMAMNLLPSWDDAFNNCELPWLPVGLSFDCPLSTFSVSMKNLSVQMILPNKISDNVIIILVFSGY
jgi:hypothetical protein